MSHSHDDANRLLEDDAYSYVYDANGNLTSKTDKASGDVTTYTWDSLDRLIQITFPDTTTATYAYDAFGRRIEKNVNGTVTRYLYDGWDILAEFDASGALLAKYSHGPYVDHPLVMERGGQTYYFHAAQDGSISHVTDAAGAVVNDYIYDAFGNRISVTETVANPYGFTAREYDPESGLYFYRARYYDPKAGRFISSDPIGFAGGDSNLYAYVFNDPVNLIDPSGLTAAGRAGTGVIGGAAAPGIRGVGKALACLFTSVLGAIVTATEVIEDPNLALIVEVADALNPCDPFKPLKVAKLAAKGKKLLKKRKKPDDSCPIEFDNDSSFSPDTLVHTDQGPIEIANLEPGDMVLARDELSGQETYQRVVDVLFSNHSDQLQLKLIGNAGESSINTLITTDGHPFYLKNKGWAEASTLRVGDQLMTSGGEWSTVVHSERMKQIAPAFNLEIDNFHTFFVGTEKVWVHNARGVGGSGKPRRHFPKFSTKKRAKEAAKKSGKGPVMKHPNTKSFPDSEPHFHSTDARGRKMSDGVHYNYPRKGFPKPKCKKKK